MGKIKHIYLYVDCIYDEVINEISIPHHSFKYRMETTYLNNITPHLIYFFSVTFD